MIGFLTKLQAEEEDEFGGIWQLTQPLVYNSEVLGGVVSVPAGFRTDFASVPRVLGLYDLEGGKCNKAAVVHDYLYSMGSAGLMKIDRETADKVLREAILASGYGAFTAGVFFRAVRTFGGSHWVAPNQKQPDHVKRFMDQGSPL